MTTPVSFELSKFLIEKGMSIHHSIYHNDNRLVIHEYPTIVHVLMWLYEKHGVWIEVTTNNNPQVRKEFVSFDARVIHRNRNIKFRVLMNTQINKYTEPFNSPTEAYENAIKYCLEKII